MVQLKSTLGQFERFMDNCDLHEITAQDIERLKGAALDLYNKGVEAGKAMIEPFQFTPRPPEGPITKVRVTGDLASLNHNGREYRVEDDGTLSLPVAALQWWLSCGIPDPQDSSRMPGRYVLDRAEGAELATLNFKRGDRLPNQAEQAKAQVSAVDKQNQLLEALLTKMAAAQ